MVSAEAICAWLYALPKGELAPEGITLRSGAAQARHPPQDPREHGSWGMTSIDARPADTAGRQVPGHSERDLAIGSAY